MRIFQRWGWRIIRLRTSWTRFLDTSRIFLKSLSSIMLFCLMRVCVRASLRLLGVVPTTILWAGAVLFLHQNFMNSLVLSLVGSVSRGLVLLLEHVSHDVVICTFDSQIIIWPLTITTYSCHNLLQAHWLFTIPWWTCRSITHNLLHLEDMSRLLETTSGLMIWILPWK